MKSWIGDDNIRPWCQLVAGVVHYAFDDLDWDAVVTGIADTNCDRDMWFEYPLVGTATIRLRMAYDPGVGNMAVEWEAPVELHAAVTLATDVAQEFRLLPR